MNDTNLGIHSVYDTPEDKEIARLDKIVTKLRAELATAKADRNTYDSAHKMEAANVLRLSAESARRLELLREYIAARDEARAFDPIDYDSPTARATADRIDARLLAAAEAARNELKGEQG